MRKAVALLALGALVACDNTADPLAPASPTDAPSFAELSTDPNVIPGAFIVNVAEGTDPAAVARSYGITPAFIYRHAINGFAAGEISDATRDALALDARVTLVEPDMIVLARYGVDQQENATWGLDRIDQRALPMDGTYSYRYTGKNVTAYVIDTGIRYTHQEFGGRASFGFDAFKDGQNGNDCNGHGTHVAGTIGGTAFGVAKDVKLIAVRVLGCDGSGATSGVVAGMDWVVQHVAANRANDDPFPAVANLSLGSLIGNTSTDNAVRRMLTAGITTVLAAGNGIPSGGVPQDACNVSPARTREALTIGATTRTDQKSTWSNYGDCVDFFAPGSSITSASWANDTDARTISGTSMAAPHVAGAAALYLERNKRAAPATVNQALYDATTKSVVNLSLTTNNHLLYSSF